MNNQELYKDTFEQISGSLIAEETPGKRRLLTGLLGWIGDRFLGLFSQAKEILADDEKVEPFLLKVEGKFKAVPKVGKQLAYVPQLALLVRSYVKGDYRELSLQQIVAIVAALIYFINPLDVIPDVIKGAGLLDDVLVVGAVISWCDQDIQAYMKWLKSKRSILPE